MALDYRDGKFTNSETSNVEKDKDNTQTITKQLIFFPCNRLLPE